MAAIDFIKEYYFSKLVLSNLCCLNFTPFLLLESQLMFSFHSIELPGVDSTAFVHTPESPYVVCLLLEVYLT